MFESFNSGLKSIKVPKDYKEKTKVSCEDSGINLNTLITQVLGKSRIDLDTALQLIESCNPWVSTDYHLFKECRYWNLNYPPELKVKATRDSQLMIEMHKQYVKRNDVFLFLGDMGEAEMTKCPDVQIKFKRTIQEMPGIKIMIKGNNDTMPTEFYYACGFIYVSEGEIFSQANNWVFSHYPYDLEKNKLGSWINIHGHIHGSGSYWGINAKNHIDVYPKIWGIKPVKIPDILKAYSQGAYKKGTTVWGHGDQPISNY